MSYIAKRLQQIFKQGSRTYFYSSLFFPDQVKGDVFALYSFVRTADDFVDQTPPQKEKFKAFRKAYERSLKGIDSHDIVIESFVRLQQKRHFKSEWVQSFLNAMEQDITKKSYTTMADTIKYMHGSAEVIGLMMCKILDIPAAAYPAAQYLGRSMQYVNFIRDIAEDTDLGRIYFPKTELKKYGLPSLQKTVVESKTEIFFLFIREQITQYEVWSQAGRAGFDSIPRRYAIPIKTATDLYHWAAQQIAARPLVIFERKVKPSVPRILFTLLKNTVGL